MIFVTMAPFQTGWLILFMPNHILVVIDAQNDFTHPKGDYARRHKGIAQITNAKTKIGNLQHLFDKENVIFVRSNYKPEQFGPGLSICTPNTFGHELDDCLKVDDASIIVAKTEHSCFSSEEFKALFEDGKKDTLVLCGFLAEYCVKETADDALKLGYTVLLVEDCIGTGDDVQHRKQQTLVELKEKGAMVVKSENYFNLQKD